MFFSDLFAFSGREKQDGFTNPTKESVELN